MKKRIRTQYSKEYRIKNLEKIEAYKKIWNKNNRDKVNGYTYDYWKRNPNFRKNMNFKQYGITIEQYNQMFVDQNGVCAICKQPTSNGKDLCVDHNHKTNKVRGLLCSKCNMAIGLFKDNINFMLEAIKYLTY